MPVWPQMLIHKRRRRRRPPRTAIRLAQKYRRGTPAWTSTHGLTLKRVVTTQQAISVHPTTHMLVITRGRIAVTIRVVMRHRIVEVLVRIRVRPLNNLVPVIDAGPLGHGRK